MHPPLVQALFAGCRPSTIGRFVMPLWVDAVHGMPRRRPWPHVGEEIRERRTPAVAHTNATTAVEWKVFTSGEQTARFKLFPGDVFGCSRSSVRRESSADDLFVPAATRARVAAFKVIPMRLGDLSAIALAAHARIPRLLAQEGQHGQSSKAVTRLWLRFLSAAFRFRSLPTAARACVGGQQRFRTHGDLSATGAGTRPRRTLTEIRRTVQHGQLSHDQPRQVA